MFSQKNPSLQDKSCKSYSRKMEGKKLPGISCQFSVSWAYLLKPKMHIFFKKCGFTFSGEVPPVPLLKQEETGRVLLDRALRGLRETDSSRCWHHHKRYLSACLSPGKIITTFSVFSQ